ncbi:UDP-N-acetylglucosamine 2-epimerase [Prosthecochloris vibrioformis]|uniref:UDP-N-acetylglucosamine 2-epimerase (Hydrolyzing) n=1 Tax=Prosthecochloris vibrioformis TaxID=1098 RepID=A0A5C4RZP2_PROVB|nr:UDP-N-acetylglucosamine 2-epimerase [Prosthecochloris vibrioformis]TNJ36600.1 UDP-N-acetylglucosamine 2-epimerase (hydrolyzing) [Prosthecochloris vibrioformis]
MTKNTKRNILFLTGTRADFGKLKSLMTKIQEDDEFELNIFVTGMHMLSKYGYTCIEVEKAGFRNLYKFINQNATDSMDHILSKTISGLSDYVKETRPDLLIIHGDRVEALAGATVGALNNLLVGHIEGGEVSGTVDELIRHATSKLSHIHFVSNESAKKRLVQLGEKKETIHVIGSPDVDVMNSSNLPTIDEVRNRYEFDFKQYGILIFHPVTTELDDIDRQIDTVVQEVVNSKLNYVIIYPNNDIGTDAILSRYRKLEGMKQIRLYPSMRFECFLTLLKNADFIIGNSSAGIREAPHFGVPTINIGTRQNNRAKCDSILNVPAESQAIRNALIEARRQERQVNALFGTGGSDEQFYSIVKGPEFWKISTQKTFVDWTSNPPTP